jgi:hypothetical protein
MSAHAHSMHAPSSLNRTAFMATAHCLTGCAIGEVLGMIIGTALGWGNAATIALAVALAFAFGYSLTMLPLLRAGLALGVALPLAFASDSLSIAVMEIADNLVVLTIPGAMDAGLASPLFWGVLGFALLVAFAFAYPLNRYLIARGQGHAVVHGHHAPDTAGKGQTRGLGSQRQVVLIGLAAIAVTITITVGAALLLDSGETHGSTSATPVHIQKYPNRVYSGQEAKD